MRKELTVEKSGANHQNSAKTVGMEFWYLEKKNKSLCDVDQSTVVHTD